MSRASRFQPPAVDELEVSVFGPGRGECIVVGLPTGRWFIVDSFDVKTPSGRVPVAVEYLKNLLGTNDVFGLFITHWHDDHTRGAADVIRAFAPSLEFVGLPGGWGDRELASLVSDLLPTAVRFKMVADLVRVVSVLAEPATHHVRTVVLGDAVSFTPSVNCKLDVLSPSWDDLRHQAATLVSYLPGWQGPRPRRYDVNSGCAVIRLMHGSTSVMLCSDLDIGETDRRGWRCIVKNHGAQLRADIIKVGHHGSDTAFHSPALKAMGSAAAMGAVTPFPARNGSLPREKNVAAYKRELRKLHRTAEGGPNSRKAGKVALKDTPFSTYTKTMPSHLDSVGQVRYRLRPSNGAITVDLFSTATEA